MALRKAPAAAKRFPMPPATARFASGVGDSSWSLHTAGGTNSSGQCVGTLSKSEWVDELPMDQRPPEPDREVVIEKIREQFAGTRTSQAPVVWTDEIARDGGVKRALDHLLETVADGNWQKYENLCDKNMTCFEPESVGYVAKGLKFHKFYFDLPPAAGDAPAVKPNVTLCDVHVRMLSGGDSAVVCYIRLIQKVGQNGPETLKSNETRVFEKKHGQWICVHFHRTPV